MEILLTTAIISYIVYLRYYADFSTKAERERTQLQRSIDLYGTKPKVTTLEQGVHEAPASSLATTPFFDRRLLINSAFVLVHSLMLLLAIKISSVIHGPYLMAAVSAAAIGFAEPRKGWFLAILQAISILVGYHMFTETSANGGKRELETFNLYGSVGLTFVGSFIGSILKRAMGR